MSDDELLAEIKVLRDEAKAAEIDMDAYHEMWKSARDEVNALKTENEKLRWKIVGAQTDPTAEQYERLEKENIKLRFQLSTAVVALDYYAYAEHREEQDNIELRDYDDAGEDVEYYRGADSGPAIEALAKIKEFEK